MTMPRPNLRDLRATFVAASLTLVTILLSSPDSIAEAPEASTPGDQRAMAGLIDAEQARAEGAWLLDEADAEAKLSFAPRHDRLVWRVTGQGADVLLDARTGEALEFTFD